jgi:hypothetical protein
MHVKQYVDELHSKQGTLHEAHKLPCKYMPTMQLVQFVALLQVKQPLLAELHN